MTSPVANRALRREIVRLAALPADDLAAILDELDPQHRRRVEQLLREFLRPSEQGLDHVRLSPWLQERIDGRVPGPTARTRETLRAAALGLAPVSRERQPVEQRTSLLGHLTGFVSGLLSSREPRP